MNYQLLYQILSTIDQSRTISQVANQLYLSQPYISQVISKSEKKYQVKLVNRSSLPIELTEAGKQLLEDLERLINDQAILQQNLSPYRLDSSNNIRIAITPVWISNLVSPVLKELQQRFPKTNFEIRQIFTSNESKKMLETRSIDIFWGSMLYIDHFISRPLYRSQACIIIPKNHPLYQSGVREIPFSQNIVTALNHSKMISLTKNSAFQSIIDHYFEDEKISLDKTMEVNSYIGAASLAIQGLGISIVLTDVLPYLDKTQEFNVVKIPKSALNLDVGISIHKDSSEKVKKVAERIYSIITRNQDKK